MPVYCLQTDDGVAQPVIQVIAQNTAHLSDIELLTAKAESAEAKGWTISGRTPEAFVATKTRGLDSPRLCVRTFWIGEAR